MAFITAETRSDLIELSVAMLKQAPSAALLEELIALSVGGGSLADAADHIAKTAAFKAEYPSFQTAEQYAAEIFDNITTGGTVTADLRTAVIELATGMLTSGSVTKSGLALAIAEYLAAPAALANEDFADIAQSFQNRAEAAEYFVVNKELGASTDAELAAAIASVTSDAATLTAANTAADATSTAVAVVPGKTLTLTTGLDALTGSAGDDTLNAVITGAGATGSTVAPGDVLNGGEGVDTLSIAVAGALATNTPYTLAAVQTNGIEKVFVSNFETTTGGTPEETNIIDGALMTGLTTVGLTASSAAGDTVFSSLKNIVDVEMMNGSADLTVGYASTTGTQTQNIAVSNLSAGTLTIAGVENLNISSGAVKSTLAALTATSMESITVTGSTDLKITGALDFKNAASATAVDGTIDASDFAGKLNVTLGGTGDIVDITGGSAADTIDMAGTFTGRDKIDGGDGIDTLKMNSATLTTQFAQTSNIENVTFNASTADTAANFAKLPAGTEKFTLNISDPVDDATKIAGSVTNANGLLINVARSAADDMTAGGAGDGGANDGVTLSVTNTVDSTADTLNLQLSYIGLTSADNGLDLLTASEYETINITANANPVTGAAANEITAITATVATGIKVSGTGALTTAFTGTKVTSFDASGLAGALTLTAGSEKATYSMGGKSSTIAFGTNLNASDTVIGGAGAADIVTATSGGLNATSGALKTTDVEYVLLTTGTANTLTLSGTTGLANLAVTDAKQTIKGLDLAATTVHLGVPADASDTSSEIDVTAADATGADDTLKVIVNTTAGAASSIIDASGIENLSLTVGRSTTGTSNTATLDMTTFEGTSIAVGSSTLAATAVVTAGPVVLGTLHKNTTTLTSTNKAAVTASMTNATTATTFEGVGTGVQNITGGLRGDTFTIGSTGAIAHVIVGGSGTDTTNLTAATGLVDVSTINTENVNIAIPASVDVAITGDFNAGVDVITLTGGNSLSTFDAGTIDTAIKTVDGSGFLGNVLADFAADVFDGTVSVTAGELTTDEITAVLTTNGTYPVKSTGVETLNLDVNGDVTASLAGTSGVSIVEVDISTAAKTATISNVVGETIRLTGSANANNVLEAKPVDATETDNAISFQLWDDATITADTQLKTTDVETVNITSITTESVDLSNLTMTSATKTVALNLFTSTSTLAGITLSATSAQTTTINAASAYGVTQTGRSATTAIDYTGSAGNDTFILMTVADKIAGGAGSDTLDVNYASVLGGISVDLSSAGEQILTMDGGAVSGSVTGFENVDLAGYTGGGASVTAIKTGSTITGTTGTDRITGGASGDTVNVTAGNDVVALGGGADTVFFTEALFINNSATTATHDGGTGSNTISLEAASINIVDADFARLTNFQTLKLVSGTNNVVIGTAAATTGVVTVNGGTGADTIVAAAGAQTINGGAGTDSITGGAGADVIDVGAADAAVDNVIQTTVGDSGTFALNAGAVNLLSTAGMDVVTNFAAGDVIALPLYTGTAAAAAANGVLRNVAVAQLATGVAGGTIVGANQVGTVRGTYDSDADTFVGAAAGADLMLTYDGDATQATTALEGIVLVGGGALTMSITAGTGGALTFV